MAQDETKTSAMKTHHLAAPFGKEFDNTTRCCLPQNGHIMDIRITATTNAAMMPALEPSMPKDSAKSTVTTHTITGFKVRAHWVPKPKNAAPKCKLMYVG